MSMLSVQGPRFKRMAVACLAFAVVYAWLGTPAGVIHEVLVLAAGQGGPLARLARLAYYSAAQLACAAGLFLLLWSRGWVCLGLSIALITLHAVDLGYTMASGTSFDSSELVVARNEFLQFPSAMGEYGAYILAAAGLYLGAVLALAAARRWLRSRLIQTPGYALGAFGAGLLMVFVSIWGDEGMRGAYGSAYRIPALLAYAAVFPDRLGLALDYRPRAVPAGDLAAPAGPRRFRNIVFIVDESVNGAYLSVNGYAAETTPFLQSRQDLFVNLGLASSGGNCSASSNYILRNGLRPDQLPDSGQRTMDRPSLFSFARRAGYRTAMLECQAQGGRLDDYMSPHDLADIDDYQQVDDPAVTYANDFLALDRLAAILAREGSHFVYLVKKGPHFPYAWRYPPAERRFVPDLPPDGSVAVSASQRDREAFLNSYLNGLRWNVDRFFERLLPAVDLGDTAIVYTSDHGQSIEDEGFVRTHCTTEDPPASQAVVPLLLFGQGLAESLARTARGRSSHFQIFPSLLDLMGYDQAAVEREYGPPLWRDPSGPRVFFSGPLFSAEGRLNPFDR